MKTKVFFFSLDNQTSWRECRRPDQRRPQWTWWKVGDKKRPGLGPDEELRDGGEDGDDDEGEQEVLALVKAGQH